MTKATVWAASHVGLVREANEDRCHVGGWRSGAAGGQWQEVVDQDEIHAAIADGMGGHRRGEIASAIAIGCVAKMAFDVADERDVIAMIAAANEQIFAAMMGPGGWPAMGTTIVGLVIRNGLGLAYNVGDSRAYLLVNSQLVKVSRDHTPIAARGHGRSHALTQSLGGTRSRVPLSPHVVTFETSGVAAVLLCSDGLSDMVADRQIEAILNSGQSDPTAALIAAALSAGGRDNVTAILVRLTDE